MFNTNLKMTSQISLVMGLLLICVTISTPFWQWLSRKMDKGPAYAIGMGVGAAVGGYYLLLCRTVPRP